MKKIIYILVLFVFMSYTFSGCSLVSSPESTYETIPPQSTPQDDENNEAERENSITIISPVFYTGDIDTSATDENTAYLQSIFAENGFNVIFDTVYYSLESPTCYEEYFSYLSQSLAKDNTLAFVPGRKIYLLSSYVTLQNLGKETEEYSPAYYEYTQRNKIIESSNDNMLVSYLSDFDNLSIALMLNSIREEYDDQLVSSYDYLKFINWAKKRNDSLTPSAVLTFHDDLAARSNILYDMFLPQKGYIPLGSYLGTPYSICVDVKKPENIHDTSTLNFYEEMLESIESTANANKIVIKHENHYKKNFNNYSSIVMPLGDIQFYANIEDYNFYPQNYSMEIINSDMLLEPSYENVYLAAAEGADVSYAMSLINWIYRDLNNYMSIKYGEAGVNYFFNDYNFISITDDGKEYMANNPISNMINSLEFESTINNMPINYLNEINSIKYLKGDNLSKQYDNYQSLITEKNYIYNSVNRLNGRWETTIRTLELTTERKVNYEPGMFKYENIDDLIAELTK
ncbi:MAG: hypothetical protein AB1Z23_04050 [Eubacteriales bacterium]